MASKNIAITEDLYWTLMKKKRLNESFTKVIFRLLEESERPSNYFGAWGELSEDENEQIKQARVELRELWTNRVIE